jgi:soluble lytic murein transglycosylase-like protein
MTQLELVALTKQTAARYGLDPVLMCAIAEQESSWDPCAVRCESESGFRARYGVAYAGIVAASASKHDDKWFRFEDLFYSSYGLLQTMYPVLIETFPEAAGELVYPTRLCDAEMGARYGCRLFARKLKQAGGDTGKALLFWNGGGNKEYPGEVIARRDRYR